MPVKKAFGVLCVVLFLLAGLEVISRMVLTKIYNRKFDSSLIQQHKYGNDTDGLKPNATGNVWGKAINTDNIGGRKHRKSKAGKPKLLIIGDSVTEGVGVDDTATFANILNNRLDSFDVRNVSLIGWSVNDYKNVVDSLLASDSMIQTVNIFYCLNDIYGTSKTKDLPAISNKGIFSKINLILQNNYATYRLIKLFIYQNSNHYYTYDKTLYHDTARVNKMLQQLTYLKRQCLNRGVGFNLFLLPYKSQLCKIENDRPQQVFQHNGLFAVDLLTQLQKREDLSGLYLFADEIHLSEKGHRAVADILAPK